MLAHHFGYIAENSRIHRFMQAVSENRVWWTSTDDTASADMALRMTAEGFAVEAERALRGGIELIRRDAPAARPLV